MLILLQSLAKLLEMKRHPLRKLAGLTALYIFILFTIIVIQFKNETIITEFLGTIRLILSEIKDEDNSPVLKNTFQVSKDGLTFFADSSNPLVLKTKDGEIRPVLKSWKKISDKAVRLEYSDDVSLVIEEPESETVLMNISLVSAPEFVYIDIPYKTGTSLSLNHADPQTLLINTRKGEYKVYGNIIDEKIMRITPSMPVISYCSVIEDEPFKFEDVLELDSSSVNAYNSTVRQIQNALISIFPENIPDTISEKAVTAWVAEMARLGKYSQAVQQIPAGFIKSARRTYLSAPYFNSLVQMNKTLLMQNENMQYKLNFSMEKNQTDILTMDYFTDFIRELPDKRRTEFLQTIAVADMDNISLSIATGIIQTYNVLAGNNYDDADILSALVKSSIKKIEECCFVDENRLFLRYNDSFLDMVDSIKTGSALLKYGQLKKDDVLQAAGRAVINSASFNSDKLDLETIAVIYPLLVTDNSFYPHLVVLEREAPVWAWTVAQNMNYSVGEDNTVSFETSFTKSDTHYMIIHGVKPFTSIEIYGLAFRTDPRFETYNSSGYVYDQESETLLLKYRQRSAAETVRLYHAAPKPKAESVEEPATAAETSETDAASAAEKTDTVSAETSAE